MIKNWEMPEDKASIQSYVGFVNFLTSFIPKASELLDPFYEAIKKKMRITPDEKTVLLNNITEIKKWIRRTLLLKLFEPQAPTVIYSDASLRGAASMVCQPEKVDGKIRLFPVSFYSLKFTPTQQRYSTMERELCAVLTTLEKSRLFLSSNITIYTDNTGIISIGNSKTKTHNRVTK